MEVLHGWTGGDGKAAIDALTQGFQEQYPDIDADFNPVGGQGNVQLNTLIVQRLSNNNPPSSWAAWPGAHLTQFTEADLLGDISDSVWGQNNMEEAYVQEAKQLSRFDGQYVCVPIGSHRMNNLFYNIEVVEQAGVDPAQLSSPSELTEALAQIEDQTDAAGMAQSMTNAVTIIRLWAATMLGSQGFQAYMDLINGNGDIDAVRGSLQAVKDISEYFNEDAPSVDPPGAMERVANGNAAVLQAGNWAAGFFKGQDLTYNEDWGWAPYPGTEGMYGLHFDAFVYPRDGPAPQATQQWLRYCGTTEAQVAFNTRKGSIPPRTDAPQDEFGPYLQETMEDYRSADQKPPTIADGLAVPPDTLTDLQSVFTDNFMGPYNVDATAQQIMETIG
ncbi:ABC transporter substrate-binding protein [Halorussus salinisoli]|uniref:ABC transporter substrate-binding protein n=1 Tax=Halorussus salinisoli TaxID=2558242 RepID=UPI001485ACB5|nr:ABC transporter substrate-binding protein [Halorussus salinisoli]